MVCFWKFCKAFEGPHSASAMPVDRTKLLEGQKRKNEGYEAGVGGNSRQSEMMAEGNNDEDKLREAEVHK